jgi:aldose 1-epimerase
MTFSKHCSWTKETDRQNDLEYLVLRAHDLEAWIAPNPGSNLCRLSVDGRAIIDFDPKLMRGDFTGTPVLYPTPNRVRDCQFRYRGKVYKQVLRGTPVYEHGLAHSEAWSYSEPTVEGDAIQLKTWLNFAPGSDVYNAFPFHHRLSLDFTLTADGIRARYTIQNLGNESIPFGFGLHPYFQKLSGEDGTLVRLPAPAVMEVTPDLLPTGKLIDVDGTQYDLRRPISVGKLDLDNVFTRLSPGNYAKVIYSSLGLSVQMDATDDFTHLVLYTPPGMSFFCLENQTCSTDAHNLYDRGFAEESGLKFVPAGQSHSGSVAYKVIQEH